MSAAENLKKMLSELYGIDTAKELDEAVERMEKPDIAVFLGGENGRTDMDERPGIP